MTSSRKLASIWIVSLFAAGAVLAASHLHGSELDLNAEREARALLDEGAYGEAIARLKPAARQGDAAALFLLGEIYRKGQGVEPDPGRALRLYRGAEAAGHAAASAAIGLMYHHGHGVPEDRVQAYIQLNRSGEAVSPRVIRQMRDALDPEQLAEAERRLAAMQPGGA